MRRFIKRVYPFLFSFVFLLLVGTVQAQDTSVQVDARGIPLLSFGDLLTFIIRMFFFVAGLAALIYGLWGALSWITSGGGSDEVKAARDKIQAAVLGVFVLIIVLSLVVALEQFVFNRQLCFGLSCPVKLPGLHVFPLDATTAENACTGMRFEETWIPNPATPPLPPFILKTGRTRQHYCRGDKTVDDPADVKCTGTDVRITIPFGPAIGGGGDHLDSAGNNVAGACTPNSMVVCCVP